MVLSELREKHQVDDAVFLTVRHGDRRPAIATGYDFSTLHMEIGMPSNVSFVK
ncbi:MAG: hypothetical protein A07HR67_01709 [uncultured archaeon A07HR67]|nr:MAG: hypothetical protein A07HR67_01709 [uncultured archaeon A07HR67]